MLLENPLLYKFGFISIALLAINILREFFILFYLVEILENN